jgi:hypothetical protein
VRDDARGPAAGAPGPGEVAGALGGGGYAGGAVADRQVALVDLLDRLLTGGAVLTGDVVLSVADVDLVHVSLRAVIRSITPDAPAPW